MHYQYLPNSNQNISDVIILPFGYEESVSGRKGTRNAPEAILEASNQIEYYDEILEYSPMQHLKVCVEKPVQNHNELFKYFKTANITNEQLFITLGGEHSITPTLVQNRMKQQGNVVFLDAHADLRTIYENNPNSHATPAYRILKQGHKLVLAGVRSLFEDEAVRIKEESNITYFSDYNLQNPAFKNRFLQHLGNLKGKVYLSIDMDVFSPALVSGVGTPQPGGLGWYDSIAIFEQLFNNKNIEICGVDIVELIPEESTVSQIFAAKMLQKIISFWAKSKGYDQREKNGSQMQLEYQ